MNIYIVRHGQTDWNVRHIIQGSTDIPLNQNGIDAAVRLGSEIADLHIDRIYASPLQRARKTAELIRGDRDIEMIMEDRLRELDFGELEGAVVEDNPVMEEFSDKFFYHPEQYIPAPGGETIQHAVERAGSFVEYLLEKEDPGSSIMLVAHGAIIRAAVTYIFGLEIKDFWREGVPPNCQLMTLWYEDGVWRR